MTLFGDSVAAALTLQPTARALLGKGIDLRIDAKVCRLLLVEVGCLFGGERAPSVPRSSRKPPTAALGEVVVVDVGYNDVPTDYGADVDRVMQALACNGVRIVIWVTMQERRPLYWATNAAIRQAPGRALAAVAGSRTGTRRAGRGGVVRRGRAPSLLGGRGRARALPPAPRGRLVVRGALRPARDPGRVERR